MNRLLTLTLGAFTAFASVTAAHEPAPAEQPGAAYDISHRANDLPGPVTRKENQRVVVELQAKEVVAELAKGVTYEYWAFNGTVPGPLIRVKEGDTVEVRLTHSMEGHHHGAHEHQHSFSVDSLLPLSRALAHEHEEEDPHSPTAAEHMKAGHGTHSIDLHAVEGPGGGAMLTQTPPGETRAFQFKATRPGIFIYHCASPHIPTHIANGLYGMILVEPKEGLPPVDREYYVMQGELYTKGKFGETGLQPFSLEKLLQERPEYFVFNGRVGALTGDHALKARVGETIRIFFGVGTHIASNFHIIGGILDRLYQEGDVVSPPRRNVQTTVVPPGGAMIAELKLEVPGKYLLVDHSLSRAIDKGAVGEIVVEGPEHPEIFNKVD
jgi:nitrite reductase (NO-forming)